MTFYCYILECANGAYYTGWTTEPLRRLKQHNTGKGASYTLLNGPCKLVYLEEVANTGHALRREKQIKMLGHAGKAALIQDPLLNMLPQFLHQPLTTLPAGEPVEPFSVVAPGRVNLLGEHIDYNQGIVLPAAIDREVHLSVKPKGEPLLRLKALDLAQEVEIDLRNLDQQVDRNGHTLPHYALYIAGVAWALQQAGFQTPGMDAELTSTIPMGAGLSSSAAVEVAFALAWKILGGLACSGKELAALCQQAENSYVGVNSGLMDQYASLFGVKGHLLQFDTRSLECSPLKLPAQTTIVIADSGVRRDLSNSAYNDRRADCEEAFSLLKQWLPDITSWRDVSPLGLLQNQYHLPERLVKRAQHVVGEIERVRLGIMDLKTGNAAHFGQLMSASHASLRDLFEVSCPELNGLVQIALALPGCLGARLTGAGFGGCTVNLVESKSAEAFASALATNYRQQYKAEGVVYLCQAAQGAHRLV